jgi:glycolate oxidase FAD binding subunit
MEQALRQFRDRIAAAAADQGSLCIRGAGTKDWYGQALQGEPLDMRSYRGIVAYDPTELVITARCGTPLPEIETALAERNQMLAFEPPRFGPEATIGGMFASGLSGPRRQAVGALRDFVLGAVMMDGKGHVLRFGGQVMKNVAGYDMSRLLAGSMGTLGLILDVSLKVLPRPLIETSICCDMAQADAIRCLNQWGSQPFPISASAWHDGKLSVRLSGARSAVAAARQKMPGMEVPEADTYWMAMREQTNSFFTSGTSSATGLWRLSVPSIRPSLALPGEQLLEWGGAQRWIKTDADATTIRAETGKIGGHATLFRRGDKRDGVFHPLAPAIARIHLNLKKVFDPSGIFNPGRMYPYL